MPPFLLGFILSLAISSASSQGDSDLFHHALFSVQTDREAGHSVHFELCQFLGDNISASVSRVSVTPVQFARSSAATVAGKRTPPPLPPRPARLRTSAKTLSEGSSPWQISSVSCVQKSHAASHLIEIGSSADGGRFVRDPRYDLPYSEDGLSVCLSLLGLVNEPGSALRSRVSAICNRRGSITSVNGGAEESLEKSGIPALYSDHPLHRLPQTPRDKPQIKTQMIGGVCKVTQGALSMEIPRPSKPAFSLFQDLQCSALSPRSGAFASNNVWGVERKQSPFQDLFSYPSGSPSSVAADFLLRAGHESPERVEEIFESTDDQWEIDGLQKTYELTSFDVTPQIITALTKEEKLDIEWCENFAATHPLDLLTLCATTEDLESYVNPIFEKDKVVGCELISGQSNLRVLLVEETDDILGIPVTSWEVDSLVCEGEQRREYAFDERIEAVLTKFSSLAPLYADKYQTLIGMVPLGISPLNYGQCYALRGALFNRLCHRNK